MTETWRPVVGWEMTYAVSDAGRVRRAARPGGQRNSEGILSPRRTHKGYWRVALHDQRRVDAHIHLLVAEAFIGPRPLGFECNHIDGNKANNVAANLEWVTPSDNARHAIKLGLTPKRPRGAASVRARLTSEQVLEIRLNPHALTYRQLAARFGVDKSHIYRIRSRRAWNTDMEAEVKAVLA